MGRAGPEHAPISPENLHISFQSGAESGARDTDSSPVDSDLTKIIHAWPDLPQAIRAGILAMIQAAGGKSA